MAAATTTTTKVNYLVQLLRTPEECAEFYSPTMKDERFFRDKRPEEIGWLFHPTHAQQENWRTCNTRAQVGRGSNVDFSLLADKEHLALLSPPPSHP